MLLARTFVIALCLTQLAAVTVHAQEEDAPAATSADTAAPADTAAAADTSLPAQPRVKLPPAYTQPAKQVFGMQKTPAKLPARAIGSYAKGCLAGGKALPVTGSAWQAMRLSRNRNWGHPKLIALLQRFATEMQAKDNWPGLLIGDLSQPRGGPMLTGHRSHQIGLDADIWFKPMPQKTLTRAERETFEPLKLAEEKGTAVIAANWRPEFVKLLQRAASYSEVERIFVHPAIKKALCDATAVGERDWLRKIRPMWSHNYHFHVRMHCPVDLAGCVPQKPTLADDGCGKDLEDWLKRVSAPPPKPKPKPPGDVKKPPPKPRITTLADLPPDCAEIALFGTSQKPLKANEIKAARTAEAATAATP